MVYLVVCLECKTLESSMFKLNQVCTLHFMFVRFFYIAGKD